MSTTTIIGVAVIALVAGLVVFLLIRSRRPKGASSVTALDARKEVGVSRVLREFTERYDSGELKHRFFSDAPRGRKEGEETFYYRSGQVNKINYWKDGKLHGRSTVFYPNGEVYIESSYDNDKLNGYYEVFSKGGGAVASYSYKRGTASSKKFEDVGQQAENRQLSQVFAGEEAIDDSAVDYGYGFLSYESIRSSYDISMRLEELTAAEQAGKNVFIKGLKAITGIKGIQDRGRAKDIKEVSERLYNAARTGTESKCEKLNRHREAFEAYRLQALKKTVGAFLRFLDDMGQKNKTKEYAVLDSIGIDQEELAFMRSVDPSASGIAASTAAIGAAGTAAAIGASAAAPAAATAAVAALASASTGTAISTLSGAAATNATLAWLGGGTLASGGGGIAGGAAVLGTIGTVAAGAAAGGVAIVAAGLLATTHFAKKLTAAKEYQKDVDIAVNQMEASWVIIDGIDNRIRELAAVASELESRIEGQLEYMEPLTVDFDTGNDYYNTTFQKTGLLIKTMSELAQVPIVSNGDVSDESAKIVTKAHSVLNTELKNYE